MLFYVAILQWSSLGRMDPAGTCGSAAADGRMCRPQPGEVVTGVTWQSMCDGTAVDKALWELLVTILLSWQNT